MMMRFALFQTNMLIWIFIVELTETTVRGQTRCSTPTHYSDSEPTSLCSFSLMPHAQRRSIKYQFHSLWFDPTGIEPTIQHTRGEHANHYTNDAVSEVNKCGIPVHRCQTSHTLSWTRFLSCIIGTNLPIHEHTYRYPFVLAGNQPISC